MHRYKVGYCFPDEHLSPVNPDGAVAKLPTKTSFRHISNKLSKRIPPAVSNEHIIPEHTPISNQGQLGSCVANAWCDALEILDGLTAGDKVEQLSRLFLYATSRILHGSLHIDSGTYNRAAAHQLEVLGTVEERYYPYDPAKVLARPTLDMYTMASSHRIVDAFSITSSGSERIHDIDSAICCNHPVVFSTLIGETFMDYAGEKVVFRPPAVWIGRHAMLVVGVRDVGKELQFLIRNSWGSGWGDNGHIWVSRDYLTWDQTSDLWVPTKEAL